MKNNRGFTLIELLITMAIIAILAGAVLVSLSAQRTKAREAKMLAELSGIIQPLMMCKSDGYNIQEVADTGAGGAGLCVGQSAYGTWPLLAGTGFRTTEGGSGYKRDGSFDDGSWWYYIDDGKVRICCNSRSSRCKMLAHGATCNGNTDLTN